MDENSYKSYRFRLRLLFGLFCLCMALYGLVMYQAQVVNAADYYRQSSSRIAVTETVEASRGVITDRNGKVLVSNRQIYTITFDPSRLEEDEDINEAILRLIRLCEEQQVEWTDNLPISDGVPYTYTTADAGSTQRARFQRFLAQQGWSDKELTAEDPIPVLTEDARKEIGLDDNTLSPQTLLELMRITFDIDPTLSMTDARKIIGVRYELALRNLKDYYVPPYIFAEDIDVELISLINDGSYAGVVVDTESVREYNTTYAAHLLGNIGAIQEWTDELAEAGYSRDDLIGQSGAESAFEEYLRGTDGKRTITTNEDGKITGEVYSTEPQPGNTVALTIDIDLQAAAEDALAATIQSMIEDDGYTKRSGALVVTEVGTGDILASATYPTYDPADYSSNYSQLLSQEGNPLWNRALQGQYPPGSTFKMITAVAALESGVITPSTKITTKGVYRYYEYAGYTPACWVYRAYGTTHGTINVSQALAKSCNYFFYEVGRLTGIETLNEYGKAFGVGQSTGVELAESTGIMDGPDYRESVGQLYVGGDLLQISIGQGANLMTPLQLSNYVATLVNGGTRYSCHLLKSVTSYDSSQVVYEYTPQVLDTVEMSASTLEAVKEGMRQVTTDMVAAYFKDCVVSAGAKTGSAQTGNATDNGVFVCFAPYDDPEIAIAVAVERGGSGSALASTAVQVINAYFTGDDAQTVIQGENTLIP